VFFNFKEMKRFLFLMAFASFVLASCNELGPEPYGAVYYNKSDVPWDGQYQVEVYIEANCNWQLTVPDDVDLVIEPLSGVGDGSVAVTVPANTTNEELALPFGIKMYNDDGQYVEFTAQMYIPKPSLTIGELEYGVVYLEDGHFWMSEPLAYIPLGYSASSDPTTGSILYPYSVKGGTFSLIKDVEEIKANGYLYKPEAFLNMYVTAENCLKLEKYQGICPDGWHIPSWSDWYGLMGSSCNLADGSKVVDNNKAIFWNSDLGYASVLKANEKGFNSVLSGSVLGNEYQKDAVNASTSDELDFIGKPATTYFACSTGILSEDGEPQLFMPMATFSDNYLKGRLSIGKANCDGSAVQVRCVKNE